MEFVDDITPLLITYNGIQNIERTLARLGWAKQLLVVDGGSTGGTLDVLAGDSRIEVRHRPFDSFAERCNFGLSQVWTEWVLSLDADYELSEELIAELRRLKPSKEQAGFSAGFVYRIYGRPLLKNPSGHGIGLPLKAMVDDFGYSNRALLSRDPVSLHGF